MAEDSVTSYVTTPERSQTDGRSSRRKSAEKQSPRNNGQTFLPRNHRASIGSCHDGDSSKRNSGGKPNSQNTGKIILPHYLRASTGSCHDFCKNGRKHALEVKKTRYPIQKRMVTPSPNEQNPIVTVAPAKKKKTAVVKLKPSPDSKTSSPDPPEIIKREILLHSKKNEVSLEQDLSDYKKLTQNEKRMNNLSVKRAPAPFNWKPQTVKSSSSLDTSGLYGRKNGDIKIDKKTETFEASVKKVLAAPTSTLSPRPSVTRIVSLNARKHWSMKLESPLNDQNRTQNIKPRQSNNEKEKTLHVVEGESGNKSLEFIQDYDMVPSPQSPLPLTKFTSHPKSSSSSHEEEDKKESEYSDTEEDHASEYLESNSESDDFISEDLETINFNEVEIVEGNHNKTPRMGGVVLSEDKNCSPTKLKFKRGKIVDLQCENNGPRRIRFRPGRVLWESQDRKGGARRSFKKRGVDDDTNGTKSNSEKVTLRHQDLQGKKDAQGLFNNVIEETASKLVESRKSKVKALVGAFETVISLQEGK